MPHEASLPDPAGYPRGFDPNRPDPRPLPTPPTPPALSSAPDVMTFLSALGRRWILATILGGTLAAIGAVAVYYLLAPSSTAYAKVKIAYVETNMFGRPGVNDFKTVLQTTAGEMTTRRVINAAMKRPEVKQLALEKREADPAQTIEDGLRAEYKDNYELLTLYFTHPDPVVAQTVATHVREAYFETIVRDRHNARTGKLNELEKLYAETVEALKRKKENLTAMASSAGVSGLEGWRELRNELVFRLRDERHQLTQVRIKLEEAKGNLETFDATWKLYEERKKEAEKEKVALKPKEREKPDVPALVEAAMETDGKAQLYRNRVESETKLVAEYERRGFAPNYFGFKNARERLATARVDLVARRKELTDRVKAAVEAQEKAMAEADANRTMPSATLRQDPALVQAQLKRQVENLTALEAKIAASVEELAKEASKVPVLGPDYDRLAAEIRRDEDMVNDMFRKIEQEKLDIRAMPRITRFGESAELMKADTKKQLLATAATPAALLFAVCAGLAWLECSKRKIRKPGEISRGLGIRVVGAVPRQSNLSKQLVGADGESELEGTPVMESIDAIRTSLLHDADARNTRLVMVTSATLGEGKTTLAAALASSLARAGRKTLLLDGDLRRPTVHELFEVPAQPGFSELLLGEVELADAAQETLLENLWIMPAGQWDREVLLALSRDGLAGTFERLGEEFDFILIDSHPVLEATDALLIGRQVDAVLLSVLSDVSQMPRVYAAQQQLANLGIRVLGAVVNAASPEEALTAPQAVGV